MARISWDIPCENRDGGHVFRVSTSDDDAYVCTRMFPLYGEPTHERYVYACGVYADDWVSARRFLEEGGPHRNVVLATRRLS